MNIYAQYNEKERERAEITCEYLNSEFNMFDFHKMSVETIPDDYDGYKHGDIAITFDDAIKSYSVTWERVRSAAGDFWRGYNFGKNGVKPRS